MPNTTPEETLTQTRLVIAVDDRTAASADHRLPAWLRARLDEAAALEVQNRSVDAVEGARRAASTPLQSAYDEGDSLVREVSAYLNSLPRALDRAAVRAHYGLGARLPNAMRQGVVDTLLRQFLVASPAAPAPDARLREATTDAITATLARIDANKPTANTGERQQAVAGRDAAWERAGDALGRVRHFLAAALPDGDRDGGLRSYGFVPRRAETRTVSKPEPAAPPADS